MTDQVSAIQVRRLSAGDLAGFRAMNAVFSEVFGEPENYSDNPPDDLYAARWLADRANLAVLAEADNRPVGAVAGYVLSKFEQDRREVFIYDLAVLESHRRLGAATKMIGEACRVAREVGAWTVFIQADTAPEDEPARALYRKLAKSEISAQHFDIAP